MKTTAILAAIATSATLLVAAPAQASPSDLPGLDLSVKKVCRDDGATRVRIFSENRGAGDYELNYRVVRPTGGERLYATTVWSHIDRRVFHALTVQPGTVVRFTVGEGRKDRFNGVFARRFTPLSC